MFKKINLIIMLLFTVILAGCEEEITFDGGEIIKEKTQIIVDIKGAVMFPGIYAVDEGSLLIDVVNLAGGFLNNADVSSVNYAMVVENNQMIVIPIINSSSNLININNASLEELMMLPKIGKAKAENIINYRMKIGKFTSIEQLKNVDGLSDAIFEEIKSLVTL